MLSIFRVLSVYSIFLIRYFADAPFYNCVAGRIGLQVRRNARVCFLWNTLTAISLVPLSASRPGESSPVALQEKTRRRL